MDPVQPNSGFTASYPSGDSKSPPSWVSLKNILITIVLLIFLLVVAVYITSPMIVTVTGGGEVSVPATNATVSFTISASDPNSPEAAVTNINTRVKTFRAFLVSKGIAETDISESQVTVVPGVLIAAGGSGYQASISMAAKTVHVDSVSSLVSNLYSQGALVVAQPILSVENQENLDKEAFDSAMKDADSQARRIGLSKWKFVRKVVSVTQVSSGNTSTSTSRPDALTGAKSEVAALNGVFKIGQAVSVTYKMW